MSHKNKNRGNQNDSSKPSVPSAEVVTEATVETAVETNENPEDAAEPNVTAEVEKDLTVGDLTAETENAADVVAETAAAPEAPATSKIIPDVLKPTPPPAMTGTVAKDVKKKKISFDFAGMSLKDFTSIVVRKVNPEIDRDINGVVPPTETVFCLFSNDFVGPWDSRKCQPNDYQNEVLEGDLRRLYAEARGIELAADDTETIITRLVAYKQPKIRKGANGAKKVAGEMVSQYKQHTVVVEVPSYQLTYTTPDGKKLPIMVGAVAYWDQTLTEDDYTYLQAKVESENAARKEREEKKAAAKKEKEEKLKLEAALAAKAAAEKAATATNAAGNDPVAEARAAAAGPMKKPVDSDGIEEIEPIEEPAIDLD